MKQYKIMQLNYPVILPPHPNPVNLFFSKVDTPSTVPSKRTNHQQAGGGVLLIPITAGILALIAIERQKQHRRAQVASFLVANNTSGQLTAAEQKNFEESFKKVPENERNMISAAILKAIEAYEASNNPQRKQKIIEAVQSVRKELNTNNPTVSVENLQKVSQNPQPEPEAASGNDGGGKCTGDKGRNSIRLKNLLDIFKDSGINENGSFIGSYRYRLIKSDNYVEVIQQIKSRPDITVKIPTNSHLWCPDNDTRRVLRNIFLDIQNTPGLSIQNRKLYLFVLNTIKRSLTPQP
jgi:hypothetical protein